MVLTELKEHAKEKGRGHLVTKVIAWRWICRFERNYHSQLIIIGQIHLMSLILYLSTKDGSPGTGRYHAPVPTTSIDLRVVGTVANSSLFYSHMDFYIVYKPGLS